MARNTVEVRVDTVDRVGELLEIAVGSGATTVGGIRFDLKDRAKLEREALRLAVADAAAEGGSGRGRRRTSHRPHRPRSRSTEWQYGPPVPMPISSAQAARTRRAGPSADEVRADRSSAVSRSEIRGRR